MVQSRGGPNRDFY